MNKRAFIFFDSYHFDSNSKDDLGPEPSIIEIASLFIKRNYLYKDVYKAGILPEKLMKFVETADNKIYNISYFKPTKSALSIAIKEHSSEDLTTIILNSKIVFENKSIKISFFKEYKEYGHPEHVYYDLDDFLKAFSGDINNKFFVFNFFYDSKIEDKNLLKELKSKLSKYFNGFALTYILFLNTKKENFRKETLKITFKKLFMENIPQKGITKYLSNYFLNQAVNLDKKGVFHLNNLGKNNSPNLNLAFTKLASQNNKKILNENQPKPIGFSKRFLNTLYKVSLLFLLLFALYNFYSKSKPTSPIVKPESEISQKSKPEKNKDTASKEIIKPIHDKIKIVDSSTNDAESSEVSKTHSSPSKDVKIQPVKPKSENIIVTTSIKFKDGNRSYPFNDLPLYTKKLRNGKLAEIVYNKNILKNVADQLALNIRTTKKNFKPLTKELNIGTGKIRQLLPFNVTKIFNKEKLLVKLESIVSSNPASKEFSLEIPFNEMKSKHCFGKDLEFLNLSYEQEGSSLDCFHTGDGKSIAVSLNGILLYPQSEISIVKMFGLESYSKFDKEKYNILSTLLETILPNGADRLDNQSKKFLTRITTTRFAWIKQELSRIKHLSLKNTSYTSPFAFLFIVKGNNLQVKVYAKDKRHFDDLQFEIKFQSLESLPSTKMFCTASNVTIRESPQILKTNKVGYLQFNEMFNSYKKELQPDGYKWYQISTTDGKTGWVRGDFVNNIKVEKRKILYKGTNVRDGPGVKYHIVDVPKVGTKFVITERKKKWIKIRYGNVIDKWTSISNFTRKLTKKRKKRSIRKFKVKRYTNNKNSYTINAFNALKNIFKAKNKKPTIYSVPIKKKRKPKIKIPKNLNQMMKIADDASKQKY